ncbi:hypothetical protein PHYSODRAFT_331464 [Phytophthora sojae]|uniref:Uncharacterized protein n=1 Tax=Phytophthora sojae (strain P6497) TaxID=1094619 RepID=G4ZFI2_PHYSP|nr:hypothetical protein PHYSODRAFT_331464 [Phytophthora sojae]EGZ17498.1 hypothetical protein PHYSODRAFT_331464 [Phytophthora sojae]|eukprot:XP_009526556.1 hypothetical protein PHYSODRAFT_331464 [Phytophthora sojae]
MEDDLLYYYNVTRPEAKKKKTTKLDWGTRKGQKLNPLDRAIGLVLTKVQQEAKQKQDDVSQLKREIEEQQQEGVIYDIQLREKSNELEALKNMTELGAKAQQDVVKFESFQLFGSAEAAITKSCGVIKNGQEKSEGCLETAARNGEEAASGAI